MANQDMLAEGRTANGFIAALDQSGGSTPGALKGYGYKGDEWTSDEEMFGLIHKMRARIISSPRSPATRFSARSCSSGRWTAKPTEAGSRISVEQGRRPFLKIDKGLADEENGVQLMKPMPDLDALLERQSEGIFGTKERSVIHLANPAGIAESSASSSRSARGPRPGLVPIIEPEVNIKSAERAAGRRDSSRRDSASPRSPPGERSR